MGTFVKRQDMIWLTVVGLLAAALWFAPWPTPGERTRWTVEERHPDGTPLVEGPEMLMPDGTWVAHGLWIQRYEDGAIEVEWARSFGADCGSWTAWYEDGTVHIRTFYYGEREQHGPYIEYHPDGSVWSVGSFDMDREDGRFMSWSPSGTLTQDERYCKGVHVAAVPGGGSTPTLDRREMETQVLRAIEAWASNTSPGAEPESRRSSH